MAKIIKLTKEHIDSCYEEVAGAAGKRLTDGVIEFKKVFDVKDRKAFIRFTPRAWVKMTLLLDQFDKEVGWYGVASRLGDEENDEYLIEDIVVYPQEVSAATVDMAEPEEMTKWRFEHIEDERYDRLYMHGHSHVRFGTSPSGVDTDHQKQILEQMGEDGFYIFMIYNKSLSRWARIYDMKKNVMFEDKDITVGFWDDGENMLDFIADAKKTVKEHTYKPTYKTPTYKTPAATAAPAAAKPQQAPPAKTEPANEPEEPPAPEHPAKNAAPIYGIGWKGSQYRGGRFYDYDDESDEIYAGADLGYISRETYNQLYDAGYFD